MKKKEMTIERKLSRYIIPNVASMVGISLYVLADTFFISRAAGSKGLTALNLTLPVFGLIFAIGSMIGIGSATHYSLEKSTRPDEADKYFSSSVMWSALFGLVFSAVGLTAAKSVMRLLGGDDGIIAVGGDYMRLTLMFAPAFMINYGIAAFVRNDGAPRLAMIATLTGGGFNIAFDYIFMFPVGMGMTGAALATGLSPVVTSLVCMAHYLSKKNNVKFIAHIPSIKRLIKSCRLGVFAFVGEISGGITTLVFNYILLNLGGNVAVAAYGVIANCSIVGIGILNGIAQGLQPLASETHGNGDIEVGKRILKRAHLIGMIVGVTVTAAAWILSDKAVALFNSENNIALAILAKDGMRLYFTGYLIANINIIRSGFMSAVGMAKQSAFISLSRGVVAIVIFAFLLSKLWGIIGVWLAFPMAEIITVIMSEIMINAPKRKK